MPQNFATDYIDVASRIVEFRTKYPDGSLQPIDPSRPYSLLEVEGAQFIVVVAAAYRSPDDPRPGIGMAQEQIPGRTPYTRGSELQNAETSAWGRAIVAALAADTKKGIASAEEVRNRKAEQEAEPLPRAPRTAGSTKRASRGEVDPQASDPWTTDGTEPERVTDAAWIEGFRQRITAATNTRELQVLQGEANHKWGEHKLSRDDAAALRAEVSERAKELTQGAAV